MNYVQIDLFGTVNEKQTIAERIMQYGIKGLGDRELIEGFICPYISKKVDSRKLADTILEAMDRNSSPSLDELKAIHGVSEELASGILIALELGRRKGEKRKKAITCPSDIYSEIRHYADNEQEHLIVMALNGCHEIIFTKRVSTGLVNRTIVHPRETFADAIRERASAIVIAHNHPSGNLEPSEDDKDVTTRIRKAGEILGIRILDHLIISTDAYYSFLEHGLI